MWKTYGTTDDLSVVFGISTVPLSFYRKNITQ